jgi:hypothetical protein
LGLGQEWRLLAENDARRRNRAPGAYMSVSPEAHSFVCKFGGLLTLAGIVLLAFGEGMMPLVAGVIATCAVAAFAARMSRNMRR